MTVQPGWYPDPAEPTTQRYWDGEGWIGAPLPVDATPPPGPPEEESPPAADPTAPAAGTASDDGTAPGDPNTLGDRPTWGDGTAPPSDPTRGDAAGRRATGDDAAGDDAAGDDAAGGGPAGAGQPAAGPGAWGQEGANGWPPGNGGPGEGAAPPGWVYHQYAMAVPPPRPHGLPLAPLGPRLAARLIDIGVLLLLNVLVNGFFVWRLTQDMRPFVDELVRRSVAGESSAEGMPATGQAEGLQVVILLIAAALWFAYEVPALANSGQTYGKRLMGVKVVPLAVDERLGFGRSLRRWNLLGLPTFLWGCCGVGFLLQLVDCAFPLFDRPLRQALHDKRAATVVVQVPRPSAARRGAKDSDDSADTPTTGGSNR
nr:RDD family protein [Micromonospora sp. DSM 115978]